MADDKAYKAALDSLNNLIDKQKALKKSTEDIKDSWNSVSTQLFGISGSEFFKQVPRTKQELKELNDEVAKMEEGFNSAAKEFSEIINSKSGAKIQELAKNIQNSLGNSFRSVADIQDEKFRAYRDAQKTSGNAALISEEDLKKAIEGTLEGKEDILKTIRDTNEFQAIQIENNKKNAKSQAEMAENIAKLKANNKELLNLSDQEVENMARILADSRKASDNTIDWLKATSNLSNEHRDVLSLLEEDGDAMRKLNSAMAESADAAKGIKDKMLQPKEVMSLGKAFSALGSKIKLDFVGSIMEFDKVLHEVQKNTGISMDQNAKAFTDMTTNVAQFGMSVGEAGAMMSAMSNELNTTNFSVLSKATEDFATIEGATGAASEDITTMAGHMMRMGSSSEDVKDSFQNISDVSKKFGISAKGVISDVSKNLGKWKNAGFQGGVESLTKMAAVAKRLNMSIDAAFDMSEKARNIEGAMTMAADLQLAGGSFSNINPMDLLAAARKGPAEMQKILGTMGKDIGKFNEKGEFEIDPVDSDRLRIVAEATGVSLEDLRNGIEKTALDGQKLAGMSEDVFSSAAKGVEGWDADMAKSSLADMMDRTKDGKIIMKTDSVDLFKQAGITDLENINETQMTELLKLKDKEKKTLEDENKKNQDLKKSFDNLVNSLLGALSIFQPALEWLAEMIRGITSIFSELPSWGKYIVAGLVGFGILFGTNVGLLITQGFGSFLTGVAGLKKGLASAVSGEGGGVLGKVKNSIVGRFKKSSPVNEDEGITESAKGMDMAKTWDGIKNSISKVADGIKGSIGSIFAFIKDISGQILTFIGDIIGQILNLATRIVDGFTTVLQSASRAIGVVQEIVGKLVSIVTKTFISLMTALGEGITAFASAAAVGLGILTPFIPIIIVLTIAIIGLAFAFKLFAEGLGALAPLITSVFNGIATVVLAVGTAVSMIISTIADSILKLSQIDAGSLFALAAGLGVLSIAMVAFGAAAMIGGVMSFFGGGMFSQLSELALIAPAIQLLANSLNSAGDGLAKLSAAADTLSLEKLEKLKELSDSMANAGAGGAAMAAMANSTGGGGGKGGDGDTRKIEISFKMNGRDIQHTVNSDTSLIK